MVTKQFSSALLLTAVFFLATASVFPSHVFAQRRTPVQRGILKQVEKAVNEHKQQSSTPSTQIASPSAVVDTLPESKTVKETGIMAEPVKEKTEQVLGRYLDNTLVLWKDINGQVILTINWTRQSQVFLIIILVTLPILLFWKKALRLLKRKRKYKVKRIEL